jgi:hypothetical protein
MSLTSNSLMRDTINAVRAAIRRISPAARAEDAAIQAARDETDVMLAELCAQHQRPFEGEVLIDSQWDNPNYWFRTALLRAALGLPNGREIAVLGEFRQRQCLRTLKHLGIEYHVSFPDITLDMTPIRQQARTLVASCRNADDVLAWRLPGDMPAAMIYDAILKRQRLASLDVTRADFEDLVVESLAGIARAQRLLDTHDFKLVVISHTLSFTYGAIAWLALKRDIPVVLPFGLFGVLRMTLMKDPQDLFSFYDRPVRAEMEGLPAQRADAMRAIGRQYLEGRFGGRADDLASVYAYQRNNTAIDRESLCRRFGWDPAKPIVGFYASNWYDWPHQLGMTQFRDFLDWTMETFRVAGQTSQFNWLFKPHPCEEWFGGVSLTEILSKMPGASHVRLAEKGWNNTAVMQCMDALVTYHGTAGIEFASLGKPVLVPDRGKYDDCGFVRVAANRAEYLALLSTRWWYGLAADEVRARAELFAGWWFCAPSWQGNFLLADDSRQDELYGIIQGLLRDNLEVVDREVDSLRDWLASGHRYSHTFKMMQVDQFQLTNL